MNRRYVRQLLAFAILALTVGAAYYFLSHHPEVGHQLQKTSPILLSELLGLYLLFMISLWLIFRGSLTLCKAKLPFGETLLVTCYSSVINFFGPLQSGPAFRALYLKKKHQISVKQYASASLVYYFFYAFYSAVFISVGYFGWWSLGVGLICLGALKFILRSKYVHRTRLGSVANLNSTGLAQTAFATLMQVSILAIIFYLELHSISGSVTFRQALIYTGSANFALFVSVTPGAIGFRESFVLVTEKLHHIPNDVVVAASLLDRGVYVAILLLLGLAIFGSHARNNLKHLTS